MAATVVTVVIFLCGVLVGRGIRLERGGVVQAAAGDAAEDVPPPMTADPVSSQQPIAGEAGLSYPRQLEGSSQPPERLRPEAPQSRSEPVAEPPAPTPERAEAVPPAVAPPPATPPVTAKPVASSAPVGPGLEIQVAAFRERPDAEALASRLTGNGYAAYIVDPAAGAPVLYRVRVGKFGEPREADRVVARLKKEEKLDPWIVR